MVSIPKENQEDTAQSPNAPVSLPSRIWTKCYTSDPRVALGKYSPLEKEILVSALKFMHREAPLRAGSYPRGSQRSPNSQQQRQESPKQGSSGLSSE